MQSYLGTDTPSEGLVVTRSLFITILTCLITTLSIPRIYASNNLQVDEHFFESKVRPLLAKHCFRCHASTAKRLRGSLQLDSRVAIIQGGDSGPSVNLQKPEDSLLLKAVTYDHPTLQMPPKGKLSAREIQVLHDWVRGGLPFPKSQDVQNNKDKTIDWKKAREFWAFRSLTVPSLPTINQSDWPRSRLDVWVLAELEKRQLSPSCATDKRSLIRRATIDLLGLLPTPEEVQRFVSDNAPDSYERLIDKLLASPHYGERWGRFWLDLARYCDVAESWCECKGQAYHYRDWVVKAINEDLPYDQFVIHQLAVDSLPGSKPADLAALGFLGRSPSYWKELKLAPGMIKTIVAEEWEERLHTIGSTFLGLTVACARCHDHKFDPITQADYYALAGVMSNIKLADRVLVPQAEIAKMRKGNPKAKIPMAPGIKDATLHVLPNGPHRTKLSYKENEPKDIAIQIRGDPNNPGSIVPRRFLQLFASKQEQTFTHGSGRYQLAQAIVSDSAHLAARVIVNRIWAHHFGRGLVGTPSNFGIQGERPSHPELLDDLAGRFIKSGWSIKWLHREIMLSATYRQSSRYHPEKSALDPENRYYWRMNRRRMEVEAWRDSILAVTGKLNLTMGGPSQGLEKLDNHRRTLYGTVKRRELSNVLRLHDFPDPTTHSAKRTPTTTPLQQLFTLNSPFLLQRSRDLVQRLKRESPDDLNQRLSLAYQLLYGRNPTAKELSRAKDFLKDNSELSWQQFAQVLLSSNEFLFAD